MFGYSDLIVDPRNIVLMRECSCPVTVDITHALQQPAGKPLEVSIVLSTLRQPVLLDPAVICMQVRPSTCTGRAVQKLDRFRDLKTPWIQCDEARSKSIATILGSASRLT